MESMASSRSRPFVYHVQPDGRTVSQEKPYTLQHHESPKTQTVTLRASLVVHICARIWTPLCSPRQQDHVTTLWGHSWSQDLYPSLQP